MSVYHDQNPGANNEKNRNPDRPARIQQLHNSA